MLTILIAIILDIILVITLQALSVREDLVSDIAEFVFFMGLLLGLFAPISGYEKPILLNQIELEAFDEQTNLKGEIFLRTRVNGYTYRYESPLILSDDEEINTEIKEKTIFGADVKVVEDENCTTPILEVYVKEANESIWTFALLRLEKEYVFYIPKGAKQNY